MSEHIKLKEEDGVLEITFARPDKKNALSNAMYRAAREALESAQTNKAIRVVLFDAEGDAFTAGTDIGDFANVANGQAGERQAHRSAAPALRRKRRKIGWSAFGKSPERLACLIAPKPLRENQTFRVHSRQKRRDVAHQSLCRDHRSHRLFGQ